MISFLYCMSLYMSNLIQQNPAILSILVRKDAKSNLNTTLESCRRLCKHKKQFKVFPTARKSFSHFSKMYEADLQDIKYDPRGLFLKLLWIEPQWYSITWNWNFSDFQWNNFQSHGIEIEILFSSDQSLMIALSVNDSLVHSLRLLRLDWWSRGRWR